MMYIVNTSGIFEWDSEKAQRNNEKHGVSFQEAITVFGDLKACEQEDLKHSSIERRRLLIGVSNMDRVLVVVFTERNNKTRIISARQTNRNERRKYEEKEN